jgi:hypothetical protein
LLDSPTWGTSFALTTALDIHTYIRTYRAGVCKFCTSLRATRQTDAVTYKYVSYTTVQRLDARDLSPLIYSTCPSSGRAV